MAKANPKEVQGDLFSRGFPKLNETYYFFTIVDDKTADFCKKLVELAKSGHISSIAKVLDDWKDIQKAKEMNRNAVIDKSNALIAFSMKGLVQIQNGLTNGFRDLELNKLEVLDNAFFKSMAKDQPNLVDPLSTDWHDLFQKDKIHGLLKVAANSRDSVSSLLAKIKGILGNTITDVPGKSAPTTEISRVDGQVRSKEKGMNGHEHFGFEDGISQPLLRGIDSDNDFTPNDKNNMGTPHEVIIVLDEKHPKWMKQGSFLVFRKLEQNVGRFRKLTEEKHKLAGCSSAAQCGAKMMGRWGSGAPIVGNPEKDPFPDFKANKDRDLKMDNNFSFTNVKNNVCPLGAHIRKTNPRNGVPSNVEARIVRNGIPYGIDFDDDKNETTTRGLLFACYQSSIQKGFQFIQQSWINTTDFPGDDAGFDPFTGQTTDRNLHMTMLFDGNDRPVNEQPDKGDKGFGKFAQLVTMQGGEYFFVPSIPALTNALGKA